MRKILLILGTTLALVLGSNIAAAPPAHAGNCTISWGNAICGRVTNVGTIGVRLISGWPSTLGAYLRPGETSTKYHKDTDGIVVYPGHRAQICIPGICRWHGPGYVKITDNITNYKVKQVRA